MLTTYPRGPDSKHDHAAPVQDNTTWQHSSAISFNAPMQQSHSYPSSSTNPSDPSLSAPPEPSTPKPIGHAKAKRPDKLSSYLKGTRDLDHRERTLLNHFVDNVLRLIFPVLDIQEQGPVRACQILHSLETNKSYYHCCLSFSAIHFKTNLGVRSEQMDRDIMQHRYKAVSHLCQALNSDQGHDTILDATLAMIFFHCSVGAPDDHLPDIPWNEHFTAVTNLVNKLGLIDVSPYTPLPFSISLTTWVDILGATMLGKSPHFAHAYRNKHLAGVPSGLRELMGCEDRIMYLISEIACLDSLKCESTIDEYAVCHHISALSTQLEHAQPPDFTLETPSSDSGSVDPERLTKNMTAVFRVAARIYLYSLVPGFDRSQPRITNLVASVVEILRFIPMGPYGFDRSLVWPLLITGSFSTPASEFRDVMTRRSNSLGDSGDFGSFGRMYRVLQEVWRLSDDPIEPVQPDSGLSLSSPNLQYENNQPPLASPGAKTIVQPVKRQPVHWRDVMRNNEWRYLLI
ncbi:hypothetical protein FE257_010891 [Aspergillus nanangensis]|uniref:Uncharacterized protein n=1 Tax=Aspergillus nanangensis TaxID=2582783 RepID=A0AAD4GX88_ASPNN|nr:hypothetical protein FE257_010891 [Aspergillus nanangensis]